MFPSERCVGAVWSVNLAVCSVKLLACSSHHVEVIDATWTQPGTSEVGTLGKELFLLLTRRAAFFLLSGPQSMRSSMTSLTNFDSANYHSSIHSKIFSRHLQLSVGIEKKHEYGNRFLNAWDASRAKIHTWVVGGMVRLPIIWNGFTCNAGLRNLTRNWELGQSFWEL